MFSCEVKAVDSTRTAMADSLPVVDTLRKAATPDTVIRQIPKPVTRYVRQTPHQDSLLLLAFGRGGFLPDSIDLPQMSSQLEYDPEFYRLSTSPWGEFETISPFGLLPSALSRSDDFFGDASYANPVPLPGSEELTRTDFADSYYLLSPTLSGAFSPLGRPSTLFQQRRLVDADTAQSKLYVTRGRGGFSNTTFTFQNHFGVAGVVYADGTFSKKNGLLAYSESKLDRFRIISNPVIATNIDAEVGLFINRLHGSKLVTGMNEMNWGDLSDNYSGAMGQVDYFRDDRSRYSATLSYRNDDQKFNLLSLRNAQRFRQLDALLSHQRIVRQHNLEFKANLRCLRFTENAAFHNVGYYDLAVSDFRSLNRLTAYGSLALRGSTDLRIRLAITLLARYQFDSAQALTVIASRGAFLPQPEMQYLRGVTAILQDTTIDYRLAGNEGIESGYSHGVEGYYRHNWGRITAEARVGFVSLNNLPEWRVDFTELALADYSVGALDRNLFFASARTRLTLPRGFYGVGGYAYRIVYHQGINYTYGPQHLASGLLGVRFPINKLKIVINAAVGGKFRSATVYALTGNRDDATMILESFLSFDLKRFHFFYNYTDLLDIDYSLNGLPQFGRSLWWGFTWEFFN
jgi:hypothetical protein